MLDDVYVIKMTFENTENSPKTEVFHDDLKDLSPDERIETGWVNIATRDKSLNRGSDFTIQEQPRTVEEVRKRREFLVNGIAQSTRILERGVSWVRIEAGKHEDAPQGAPYVAIVTIPDFRKKGGPWCCLRMSDVFQGKIPALEHLYALLKNDAEEKEEKNRNWWNGPESSDKPEG